jgi:hypothetical protein
MRKYWDLIGGIIAGVALAVLARFELHAVQLYYSVIILLLVSVGFFRIIRQSVEKQRDKRRSLPDKVVDALKPVKAISLAQNPLEEGERLGGQILSLIERIKEKMEKVKVFFDKFKGYMLTIALAVLTAVEQFSGVFNSVCGGVFEIGGVAVLPIVTLAATTIVGLISNGYTKAQKEKINAIFSKSSTNEIVIAEIKKTIKDNTARRAQYVKAQTAQEHELAALTSEHESAKRTLTAKQEMFAMIPQLATADDVQTAQNEVVNCEARINDKKAEIEKTKATIEGLTTTIKALQSQL